MNGRIVLVERENLNSSHCCPLLSLGTKTPFGRRRDVGDLKKEKDGMLAQKKQRISEESGQTSWATLLQIHLRLVSVYRESPVRTVIQGTFMSPPLILNYILRLT